MTNMQDYILEIAFSKSLNYTILDLFSTDQYIELHMYSAYGLGAHYKTPIWKFYLKGKNLKNNRIWK